MALLSGKTAVITVNLLASSSQQVSVQYATNDDGAEAGVNYTATNGTLTFPVGSTSETFSVPIINNNATGPYPANVLLTLSNPTNASLGSQSESTLAINDLAIWIRDHRDKDRPQLEQR